MDERNSVVEVIGEHEQVNFFCRVVMETTSSTSEQVVEEQSNTTFGTMFIVCSGHELERLCGRGISSRRRTIESAAVHDDRSYSHFGLVVQLGVQQLE